MHRQRIWLLVGSAIVLAGFFVPWGQWGKQSFNAFDHLWFRFPLIGLLAGVVGIVVFGNRRLRVAGPAKGTLAALALLIAAIAALLAYSLSSASKVGFELGWGILVTLAGTATILWVALVGRADFVEP